MEPTATTPTPDRTRNLPRYVPRDRVWVNGEDGVAASPHWGCSFEWALTEYCDECCGCYPYGIHKADGGDDIWHHHEFDGLVRTLVDYPESFFIPDDLREYYSAQELWMLEKFQDRLIHDGAHDVVEADPVDTEVIAAFPGTGKTVAAQTWGPLVLDLDCTPYKYLGGEKPRSGGSFAFELTGDAAGLNPDWPQNYCNAVDAARRSGEYQYVLVCSDILVLSTLERMGIRFGLYYPDDSQKDVYERLFRERGECQEFIDVYIGMWDCWMDWFRHNVRTAWGGTRMKPGEYLASYTEPWDEDEDEE